MDPVSVPARRNAGTRPLVMLSSVFENPGAPGIYEAPFGIGYCVASFEPE